MKKYTQAALLALAATTALAGCQTGSATEDRPAPAETSQISQALSASDAATFVQDNRAFGIELYKKLSSGENSDKNLLISPYSIAATLAMTYAGAREETASQIAKTAHFTLPEAKLHQAFASLDADLARRAQKSDASKVPFQLEIVNTPWLATGYTFKTEYLELLANNYKTEPRQLDFATDPNATREQINRWISDHTNERIQELLRPGTIDAATKLVLTNAIAFKAGWAYPFKEAATQPGQFNRMDGSTVEVPMMNDRGAMRYGTADGHQIAELPYAGHDVSMILILPKDDLQSFEKTLTPQLLDRLISKLDSENGQLTLPKFSYSSDFDLPPTLQSLGITNAFDSKTADFSGIDGAKDLYISQVVHKSFIAVDEQGTEAAAATAAAISVGSGAPSMGGFQMNLNRPFLYLIYDRPTSSVLFMGRLTDPSN